MNRIQVKKIGMAFGLTGALIYLGCMIILIAAGQDVSIKIFNSLFHGLDASSIIRMDVPLWEAFLGIIQTFVLAWLTGATIAAFYNAQLKTK